MRYFNFIASIVLSVLYVCGKIPPTEKFNLWATGFIIPIGLLLNIVLLLISLVFRKKSSLYYLVALFIGGPYIVRTVGMKHLINRQKSSSDTFAVMSYNIGGFKSFSARDGRNQPRKEYTNWLLQADADILCFQEFENLPWSEDFNILERLTKKGLHYYFSREGETSHSSYGVGGIIIISKFPIVRHGDLFASSNGFNRAAYADVAIGRDTIRVINAHLQSMGLRMNPRDLINPEETKSGLLTILRKLKAGTFERSEQNRLIIDFIETSPYPVVCAGDFNDLPYTYSYQMLRKKMKNTFEESGKGFGFTYGGRHLSMLRIDNQFYTPPVSSLEFETLYDIRFSDHYPIRGVYQVKK